MSVTDKTQDLEHSSVKKTQENPGEHSNVKEKQESPGEHSNVEEKQENLEAQASPENLQKQEKTEIQSQEDKQKFNKYFNPFFSQSKGRKKSDFSYQKVTPDKESEKNLKMKEFKNKLKINSEEQARKRREEQSREREKNDAKKEEKKREQKERKKEQPKKKTDLETPGSEWTVDQMEEYIPTLKISYDLEFPKKLQSVPGICKKIISGYKKVGCLLIFL